MTQPTSHFRILLVDDNPAIHEDFRKILLGSRSRNSALEAAEAVLFGTPEPAAAVASFEIESAYQGQEALDKLKAAYHANMPYALAFVDVRMPPGWDGIETIEQLWRVDPALQVVICTAYADYSWEKMAARLGTSDSCVILKKPFDNVEVLQLAHAMTKKWTVTQQAQLRAETLDRMVQGRTRELQAANAELRRSEERFAAAFRSSPVPLAIQCVDDHRFVDANEAFAAMTGFTAKEIIGRTPSELPLCMDYNRPRVGMGRIPAVVGGAIRNVEAQVSTKSGDLRSALLSIEQIVIDNEPHSLLIVQDISERLRLETQLRQAQKMEAIGQLAAGIAHDFNNLLTIIQGHASLQLSMGLPKENLSSLQQIEEAAQRAAELTRQLLAFSRRQIIRPKVLDLGELAQRLGTMLRRLIGERIELTYELGDALPSICADPTSIEQIIMNLVVNARDAMPKGGRLVIATRTIEVCTEHCESNPEAQTGEHLRLSVTDNGVGMDASTRTRIFEPFFTTKEVHKGTGMGLATVYGLAKQHEGWVEVITAPGEGSTFHVYFPVTNRSAEPAEIPATKNRSAGREHTILIVEDDHAVRGLVKEVLIHDQYRVLEADNAASATEVWREHSAEIELLLTDIVMPGEENGLELSQRLLLEKPDLKVIYTSGYSADLFSSDIDLKDGINYLPKPYLSSKLTDILRNALEPEEEPVVRGSSLPNGHTAPV